MRETTVDKTSDENFLYYYTSEQKHLGHLKKLIAEYPDEVQVRFENPDGGIEVKMPATWFREPRPPQKGRQYTEEQKAELAERLKLAREKKATQTV